MCDPLVYTRAISERFRDKGLMIKRYINSSVYLLTSFIMCGVILRFGALKVDEVWGDG